MSSEPEIYLGDSLYASFDGWMIWLRAHREHGDHWVGIEPTNWIALKRFAEQCYAAEDHE